MDKKTYQRRLEKLQSELNVLQQSLVRSGGRAVIVLEGWDAAGKGGIVRRMAWCLDPRGFKVWSIGAPDVHEQGEHWLKRFWSRVPRSGEIAAFDRSWYGRVLVERVEGFATSAAWQRAYDEIRQFEASLLAEDYRIAKLFLDISAETQLQRFRERYDDPHKRWKLTPEDLRNRRRHADYEAAYAEMLEHTSQPGARWQRIAADDKRAARIACFEHILSALGDGLLLEPSQPEAEIVEYFERGEGAKR